MAVLAFLALALAAEPAQPSDPVAELEKTKELLEDNADGDVDKSFGKVDSTLADLKAKLKADRDAFAADDEADGVDPSHFPPRWGPSSLAQVDPMGKVEQRLRALEQSLGPAPSSLAQTKEAGVAQTLAHLQDLQMRIKANEAKLERRAAPSSLLQYVDKGYDKSVQVKIADLEKEIKVDGTQFKKLLLNAKAPYPGSSFLEADPQTPAGLLQELHAWADQLHRMANPPNVGHRLETMAATVQHLKQHAATPASLAQVKALEHNLEVARDVIAGKRAMPLPLSKMLAGIRAKDLALRRKAAKVQAAEVRGLARGLAEDHVPSALPQWMQHVSQDASSLLQSRAHSWANPEEDIAAIQQKLKGLVAKMQTDADSFPKGSSFAETGALQLAPAQVEQQLKAMVAKINAFTAKFRQENHMPAAPSSLLQVPEGDVKGFQKLDQMRADLKASQLQLVEARKLLPFADANADADIHLRASEARARQAA